MVLDIFHDSTLQYSDTANLVGATYILQRRNSARASGLSVLDQVSKVVRKNGIDLRRPIYIQTYCSVCSACGIERRRKSRNFAERWCDPALPG